jgi:superfamily I DNA and/or RNA helicase
MASGSGSPEGTPFVVEAGQVSLANTIAMGVCARNIILVGDQMQLSQPTQGSYPGRSGLSALEHLLGAATVSPERGVFLSKTRRMHPDLCRFISNAFYDGRLLPETGNERQGLILNLMPIRRSKLQVFGSSASSTSDAPRNPNRRLPMVGNRRVFQRLANG